MHDLELVVVGELGCGPALARHQFAVEFNRNPVRLHAESLKEIGDSQGRIELAIFAIDDEIHLILREEELTPLRLRSPQLELPRSGATLRVHLYQHRRLR
jgi:hypothetical protein